MAQGAVSSIAIIVACILGALFVLSLLRHYWKPSTRLAHNDVVGPNVSVIGTTYAVLIAFMLSGVWNNLQQAGLNAEQEANSLVNIFRFAYHLPPESRTQIQDLARGYCQAMIAEEWPLMAQEKQSPTAHRIMQQLWSALSSVQPRNTSEQTVMDHSLSELSEMTEHRRIRLLQSRQHLPALLWAVLIVGGLVTVVSTCLFGVENFKLHVVQVFEISFLLSLMLVAIASINRPYQGDVHVGPGAFQYALETMNENPADTAPPPATSIKPSPLSMNTQDLSPPVRPCVLCGERFSAASLMKSNETAPQVVAFAPCFTTITSRRRRERFTAKER